MTQIEEVDVQEFILDKVKVGLAKKTVRDIIAVLRAIVKYGARQKLFEGEDWQLDYPTVVDDTKLPILSLTHQRKLMTYLTKQPDARNIGILIALCTGMRIGEICALMWEDVDLLHRMLRVRQTVGRIYNCDLKTTERVFSTPKTKHSFREIPISKLLFDALSYIKKQSTSTFVVGSSIDATDPRTYRDYFARLLKKLQIPPIVFHGLRHTFATRCIESLCDYKTVSSILGHSNVSTTLNLYVHPNIQQKKRCIDKMSKFIEGGML
uniref:Site-specific integrase n=1 Tax=Prevotella sp. GTC17262 TaxID=3236797 RepID=A0AB33JL80_9BACT